ncbi:hypothetical protein BUALT_Bualt08G0000200 [Buddleja alternifolia]|uniref:Uncharacterized protein n=1 Tax=Buddleja alternifolia TaxID=168488 RepID=A0AAV6XDB4_9LAMI|nr:hypothetical protein BUALT_Bualt08G0000200 [Buddleja alternifolia]
MPPTPLITWGKLTSPSPMTHIKPSPQNHYNLLHLVLGLRLNIPIRRARPTPNQIDADFRYLLTYVVICQGNIANSIADAFSGPRANFQGILSTSSPQTRSSFSSPPFWCLLELSPQDKISTP